MGLRQKIRVMYPGPEVRGYEQELEPPTHHMCNNHQRQAVGLCSGHQSIPYSDAIGISPQSPLVMNLQVAKVSLFERKS